MFLLMWVRFIFCTGGAMVEGAFIVPLLPLARGGKRLEVVDASIDVLCSLKKVGKTHICFLSRCLFQLEMALQAVSSK